MSVAPIMRFTLEYGTTRTIQCYNEVLLIPGDVVLLVPGDVTCIYGVALTTINDCREYNL